MSGYVHFEVDAEGNIIGKTHLEGVSKLDLFMILNGMCESFHLSDMDLGLFFALKEKGLFKRPHFSVDQKTDIDISSLVTAILGMQEGD